MITYNGFIIDAEVDNTTEPGYTRLVARRQGVKIIAPEHDALSIPNIESAIDEFLSKEIQI